MVGDEESGMPEVGDPSDGTAETGEERSAQFQPDGDPVGSADDKSGADPSGPKPAAAKVRQKVKYATRKPVHGRNPSKAKVLGATV